MAAPDGSEAYFFDKTTEFDRVVEVLRQLPGAAGDTEAVAR